MGDIKKVFILFLCILAINLIVYKFVDASIGSAFGGEVQKAEKSQKIEDLENQGYKCLVPGKTFDIKSSNPKYPTAYFVPFGTKIKGEGKLDESQTIKGTYKGKTAIVCVKYPPPQVRVVVLDTLYTAGHSKK